MATEGTIDDEAFLAALDPECVPALLAVPALEPEGDPIETRRSAHAVADAFPLPRPPHGVTCEEAGGADGVPALRIYRPAEARYCDVALLWLHGGGLIAGAARYDDRLCADLAAEHGCVVVSVDYRLAPESPYPGPLDDCLAAARWATGERGPGARRLVVAGASAGGGLAIGLALRARDRGDAIVAGLVLAYPMLDDRSDSRSMQRITARRTWHREANLIAWRSYLAGVDHVPSEAAPGRAGVDELRGLPPVHIDVGTLDAFLDEDVDFAHRLIEADVAVELVVTPRACHGSEHLNPSAPTSRRILAARRDAIERMLDAAAATSSRRS